MSLNDPEVVRDQYASEAGLVARRALYESSDGTDARDVVFQAVAEGAPARVLEVGCGPGELADRIARELGSEVTAVDVSPRMVELARERGVSAQVGDVQQLPFSDSSFGCAVAAWMLFHAADLDRAIGELARVLRPGGRLVAATNSERHLEELWTLVGTDVELPFNSENGAEALAPHFAHVERRDVDGWVTFPDRAAAREYIASSITRGHSADAVPDFSRPLRAGRLASVFVAEKAP